MIILKLRDAKKSLALIRLGPRKYMVEVETGPKKGYILGPAGVPCTRAAALDYAFEQAEQLRLLHPVLRKRMVARRELGRASK